MKTLRLHGIDDVRLHDEPMPVPSQGQQLFKITSVGICGSDLDRFAEKGIGDARLTRPLVTDHFALEHAAQAFETAWRRGGIKVMIQI